MECEVVGSNPLTLAQTLIRFNREMNDCMKVMRRDHALKSVRAEGQDWMRGLGLGLVALGLGFGFGSGLTECALLLCPARPFTASSLHQPIPWTSRICHSLLYSTPSPIPPVPSMPLFYRKLHRMFPLQVFTCTPRITDTPICRIHSQYLPLATLSVASNGRF